MMTCAEFAAKLNRAASRAASELSLPTAAVMDHVANEAKAVLGTYAYGWPALAQATIERGNPDNTPGLVTGAMQGSVEFKAQQDGTGAEGLVYSDMKEALWFEMGTVNQPARSFLFKSLWLATPTMAKEFGAFAEYIFVE